jgi:hypothetical protein
MWVGEMASVVKRSTVVAVRVLLAPDLLRIDDALPRPQVRKSAAGQGGEHRCLTNYVLAERDSADFSMSPEAILVWRRCWKFART